MIGEIAPGDALLLFRKFESEGSKVLCFGKFWGWRLLLLGTIAVSEDGNEIILFPKDRRGSLTLRLDLEGEIFWYSEPGRMPSSDRDSVPEAYRDAACVSVSMPFRVPPSAMTLPASLPRDKLFFLEFREGMMG